MARITIYCTYCWQQHWVDSLETYLKSPYRCGSDPARLLLDKREYHEYVGRYMQNGKQHPGEVQQMTLEGLA